MCGPRPRVARPIEHVERQQLSKERTVAGRPARSPQPKQEARQYDARQREQDSGDLACDGDVFRSRNLRAGATQLQSGAIRAARIAANRPGALAADIRSPSVTPATAAIASPDY